MIDLQHRLETETEPVLIEGDLYYKSRFNAKVDVNYFEANARFNGVVRNLGSSQIVS